MIVNPITRDEIIESPSLNATKEVKNVSENSEVSILKVDKINLCKIIEKKAVNSMIKKGNKDRAFIVTNILFATNHVKDIVAAVAKIVLIQVEIRFLGDSEAVINLVNPTPYTRTPDDKIR